MSAVRAGEEETEMIRDRDRWRLAVEAWGEAGYEVNDAYAEEVGDLLILPNDMARVQVGDVVQERDMILRPAGTRGRWQLAGWDDFCKTAPLSHGKVVTAGNFFVARPIRVIQPLFWRCRTPGCRDRENDRGHACYWCGAPEVRT